MRSQPLCYLVALRLAGVLWDEVSLYIGHVGRAAKEVVPHKTVEVVRGRRADIALEVGDLRDGPQVLAKGPRGPRGLLKGSALGHVDDDLELALVVKGEHLHGDRLEGDEEQGKGEQGRHCPERAEPEGPFFDERGYQPHIRRMEPRGAFVRVLAPYVPQHPVAEPGAYDERHEERKEHGGGGAHGYGPHVRAHEPRYERHRQERGYDREGSEYGRVADLVHRRHGGIRTDGIHPEVPVDVLHHDYRVIYEYAYGEYESK